MRELAESARLEIVCGAKPHRGFESLSLRQQRDTGIAADGVVLLHACIASGLFGTDEREEKRRDARAG